MTSPDGFGRHDRVRLKRGWTRYLRSPLDKIALAEVEAWVSGGRSLVVARRLPGDSRDDLRLGLALPGRRRVAVHVARKAVARHDPPPGLRDVLAAAPPSWRQSLEWLAAILGALAIPSGVYGSLAWQYFAQDRDMAYLTPGSDLDMLFRPGDWGAVQRLLRELGTYETIFKVPRLDGEIILPDGSAVAWRELAAAPDKLLTKSLDTIEMRPMAAIMALFQRRAA